MNLWQFILVCDRSVYNEVCVVNTTWFTTAQVFEAAWCVFIIRVNIILKTWTQNMIAVSCRSGHGTNAAGFAESVLVF